jgi:NADH:ubiquinone reductase (H+-translocating)
VVGRRLFPYDTLIIAIGSLGNDFGTPGVREHAILLDSADEAKRFHERLLDSFLRAQRESELLKPEQLNLAIIGAGATGTELAAELRSATRQLAAYGYDRIDPGKDVTINLIEAVDRILPVTETTLGRGTENPAEPWRPGAYLGPRQRGYRKWRDAHQRNFLSGRRSTR